jgi:hypothetical protein
MKAEEVTLLELREMIKDAKCLVVQQQIPLSRHEIERILDSSRFEPIDPFSEAIVEIFNERLAEAWGAHRRKMPRPPEWYLLHYRPGLTALKAKREIG